ncbi:MAG TPA: prepilin-type N-terminal cleavage/methylation domain-containing protein [Candidatus Ratteibacteria bacterium]|jgi:hypothetical protein|uniref:Prepilin-type N-terminal cleavage/methylation domain-containing protein n=1 Tax=candidate division TA06 bacterium ADurb.Bin131 TaxID=1852827 RepID=A0A1V6CDP1_UNCT6|nr:MAG: hypothetical protein BWX89_00239 [candidate division TA06 bacterium ADurb.Bin131]HOC01849.1 prepilin-type N-terminal cleavage/methylation domain-containing protein [bacterium]HRS06043.1 prepilin-type N-terminal cleavage/methylation domain-containing protein [Candidatus Ratteibacteria bacterium]HON04965.1 prepilin-type N-terminal cleavage/methylation domain-containing protein [bacterium]HOQ81468.1 prepilin-type N-terminal cleavage/methylation domain-containing protein [bacterium]
MKNKTGLTLIELVVALGIGVILLDSTYEVLLKGIAVLNNAYSMQRAAAIVESQMEIICSSPSLYAENGTIEFSPEIKEKLKYLQGWNGTINISDYPERDGLKMIEVSLTWQESTRNEHFNLITLRKNEK